MAQEKVIGKLASGEVVSEVFTETEVQTRQHITLLKMLYGSAVTVEVQKVSAKVSGDKRVFAK